MRHARRRVRRPDRRYGRDQRGYADGIRVAVVTGGSSGIGAATARRLTERGWRCVLLARGRERLERVAGEVGAEAEQCDVGDRAQVEETARRIGERYSGVDLLVNNAGIAGGAGFLDIAPEKLEQVTRINYLGGVWCVRAFLPLLEAHAPSDVVNVVSVAGSFSAFGTSGAYTASKHAQLAFSRNVATELAPRQIRVHTVSPGFVVTEGFPMTSLLARPWTRWAVIGPDRVAAAIVKAVERGKPEIFVPEYYRIAATTQALVPGTLARVARRLPWKESPS